MLTVLLILFQFLSIHTALCATNNNDVLTTITIGNVNTVNISCVNAMEKFREELDPQKQSILTLGITIAGTAENIKENMSSRLNICKRNFSQPEDKTEYLNLTVLCAELVHKHQEAITSLKSFTPELNARKSALSELIEQPCLIAHATNSAQSIISDRESRLLKSGKRSHITKRDGTRFVKKEGKNLPVISHNMAREDMPKHILADTKCKFVDGLLKSIREIISRYSLSNEWIECSENTLLYNQHSVSDQDTHAMRNLAKKIFLYSPQGDQKTLWGQRYKEHSNEIAAIERQFTNQDNLAEEAAKAREAQMRAQALAEQTQETEEELAKKAQIRLLRKSLSENSNTVAASSAPAAASGSSENSAAMATRATIIPSEIVLFNNLDLSSLTADEIRKYETSIAAIRQGQNPSDFRGSMNVESINVLHSGISNAQRIYYVLQAGKAYILDVSNHDMNSLKLAVQRLKQETK